ncbi:MAG TPA: 4'-phosphopantetheinyl transferase superfamily protein [Xanthomonadaceae bacterium]|nr:4'-phosphopantetheinyl transferase superfamily protein [Xanthomonadaceae bacterium]
MLPFDPPLPAGLQCAWLAHRHGEAAEPLVRAWLGERLACPPEAVVLSRDARGRPRLAHPAIDVNWAHSGDGLLAASGEGLRVGIDLERLHARPRALELARRFFAASECDWLLAQPATARDTAFLRLWCAKEAVLKAHGHGLSFGLHRLVFVERDGALQLADADPALGGAADWTLREFVPHAGYRAALAWRPG